MMEIVAVSNANMSAPATIRRLCGSYGPRQHEEDWTGNYFPRNGGERCWIRHVLAKVLDRDLARAVYRHTRRRNLSARWAIWLMVGLEVVRPRAKCNSSMTNGEGSSGRGDVPPVSSRRGMVALRANRPGGRDGAHDARPGDLPDTCWSLDRAAEGGPLTQRDQEFSRFFLARPGRWAEVHPEPASSSSRRHAVLGTTGALEPSRRNLRAVGPGPGFGSDRSRCGRLGVTEPQPRRCVPKFAPSVVRPASKPGASRPRRPVGRPRRAGRRGSRRRRTGPRPGRDRRGRPRSGAGDRRRAHRAPAPGGSAPGSGRPRRRPSALPVPAWAITRSARAMASASSADGTDRRPSMPRSSTGAGPTCQTTSASTGRIRADLADHPLEGVLQRADGDHSPADGRGGRLPAGRLEALEHRARVAPTVVGPVPVLGVGAHPGAPAQQPAGQRRALDPGGALDVVAGDAGHGQHREEAQGHARAGAHGHGGPLAGQCGGLREAPHDVATSRGATSGTHTTSWPSRIERLWAVSLVTHTGGTSRSGSRGASRNSCVR